MANEYKTEYASAQRAEKEELEKQVEALSSIEFLDVLLSSVGGIAIIVNQHRQVIYSNKALLDMLGIDDYENILGFRPGEILGCINCENSTGGCGTTKCCRYCGAVNAILESQKTGNQIIKDCQISIKSGKNTNSMDLTVKASPLSISGDTYTVVSLTDISDIKRRKALERIFYHDVLNTAGGISGLALLLKNNELLKSSDLSEISDIIDTLYQGCNELIEEISAQRDLSMAENNDLKVKPELVDLKELLNSITKMIGANSVGKNKQIEVIIPDGELLLITDRIILNRVLVNLLKNALEASEPNQIVTLEVRRENNIEFIVSNMSYMPDEVQCQLFQRSFSTKDVKRGLGTYSVKLLTERYLNGTVYFTSNQENGTEFHVLLPDSVLNE